MASESASSLREIIDLVVAIESQVAALHARRAELIDTARESSASGRLRADQPHVGWGPHVVARRELVSSFACALRMPERAAENLIEASRALVHDLPATLAALSSGAISYRNAEVIVDHAGSLPPEAVPEFESAVAEIAPDLTNAQLEKRARRIRERMHPESITERRKLAVAQRCVELTAARDGMAWLSAYLPAPTATAAYNRITELALDVEGPGESATLTQLRADVFGDLLVDGFTHALPDESTGSDAPTNDAAPNDGTLNDGTLTDTEAGLRPVRSIRRSIGRGIRASVHVTVPVMTLLGGDAPAELEGYGPIDPATARELAAGAPSFHRILTHPESGAVLSVGRDSYAVPADLRRWLVVRDETCRFPGCSRSARRSDLDHTLDWQFGSSTEHRNLAHLCPSHHHLKHHTAWSYVQDDRGRLEWTAPTGHRYATEPVVFLQSGTVEPSWDYTAGGGTVPEAWAS